MKTTLKHYISTHNSRRSLGWKRRRVAREKKLARLRAERNPHVVVGASPEFSY